MPLRAKFPQSVKLTHYQIFSPYRRFASIWQKRGVGYLSPSTQAIQFHVPRGSDGLIQTPPESAELSKPTFTHIHHDGHERSHIANSGLSLPGLGLSARILHGQQPTSLNGSRKFRTAYTKTIKQNAEQDLGMTPDLGNYRGIMSSAGGF